jgi:pimeloyl-ACP methyl ester carboxylesterase
MTESQIAPQFFTLEPGRPRLACLSRDGNNGPGLFWLGGYRSDMRGAKATFIDALAAEQSRACLRFDYSGHGESEGAFADGTIGQWADEACAIFRALTHGPQIVIGSSMGGWIALLLARALTRLGEQERLGGMILIAPAVDFSEELVWPNLPQAVRATLARDGLWQDSRNIFTRKFFEDGRRNLVFGGEIRTWCPVHILQGMADDAVPWRHALKLLEHLAADPAVMCLIRDGDHRLSRPQDLRLLGSALAQIAGGGPYVNIP